jgi:hypothetical protein
MKLGINEKLKVGNVMGENYYLLGRMIPGTNLVEEFQNQRVDRVVNKRSRI